MECDTQSNKLACGATREASGDSGELEKVTGESLHVDTVPPSGQDTHYAADGALKQPTNMITFSAPNQTSDKSSSSSPASSRHSSEDHDAFIDDLKLEIIKANLNQGVRFSSSSPSFTGSKPRINLGPTLVQPKLRSISISDPSQQWQSSQPAIEPPQTQRLRSQSCANVETGYTKGTKGKMSRLRKISTSSLGSFGTGYEALMTNRSQSPQRCPISRQGSQASRIAEPAEPAKESPPPPSKPKHPDIDGGYAWVVVFAAGMAFFIGGGFGRCFPLVYQQLMGRFGSSATATAWVAAMHGAVKLCSSKLKWFFQFTV